MKIALVVVLYNCRIDESQTLNSLVQIEEATSRGLNGVEILIYDNGPTIQSLKESHPASFRYFGHKKNEGLAFAYNRSLKVASQQGAEWLILLDQDTKLPLHFLSELIAALESEGADLNVKAAAPRVLCEGMCFSPSRVLYGGILRPLERNDLLVSKREVFAIGSGSAVKVDFLLQIGGFSEEFWLDSLDRWLYHTIHLMNGRVLLLDIELEHELSVTNYDKYITEDRYRNILKYEALFLRRYKPTLESVVYALRLLFRTAKLFTRAKNKRFALITLGHLTGLLRDLAGFGIGAKS